MKFADLICTRSSPTELFRRKETGRSWRGARFAAMALTDHRSVEGCARMRLRAARRELNSSPTELTAELGDTELHLLGIFLDTHNEKLLTEIAKFQIVRQSRIHEWSRPSTNSVCRSSPNGFRAGHCKISRASACRARDGESWLVKNLDEASSGF